MFPVIVVPDRAAEISEQMGTKYKFWYEDERFGRALFKEGRPGTGENWAEKVACELATLLDLPHAHYELATFREKSGTVTPSLVSLEERIIHGNEMLAVVHPNYVTAEGRQRQRQHTITAVLSFFRFVSANHTIRPPSNMKLSDRISDALDVFVGYLMFDSWIGNQDRHDQNWGLSRSASQDAIWLLPSYDHGSSLNRNELDAVLCERMITEDIGRHISTHARKARSAIYPRAGDVKTKALLTTEAFAMAARLRPEAAVEWIDRLQAVSEDQIEHIVDQVPPSWMSDVARQFVRQYLRVNRSYLLKMDFRK